MTIESVTASAGDGGGSKFAVDTISAGVQVPYTKLMSGTDAAEDLIGGDAANGLDVDVTRLPEVVLSTGTNTNEVVGDAAHDSPVAGNPVLIAGEARTSDGAAVTSGDAVRFQADTLGKQVVLQGSTHDMQANGTANYTSNSAADVIAAAGSGVRIAVTSVLVTNGHANVSTKVTIRDGTTSKIVGYAVADGGGFSLNAGGRPLFIATANTAVTAICGTTGSDIDVSISGYKIGN